MDLFTEVEEEKQEKSAFARYATEKYLTYALTVVKGRALPDLADGLKPVQRRLIFAANALGLTASSKHMKSARLVGDVLGKYHPHGDSAAYEAMVRLAQDFSMRYPLFDGQGNFGTRDGDGAAAMRYTETRLTPIAQELLLAEMRSKGIVQMNPTYDGSFLEPVVLPARLPFVLLNGSSGIGVGMATEIPSHNLREVSDLVVKTLKSPNISDEKFYEDWQGPDFPGGGTLISKRSAVIDAYKTGRGSLSCRAKWEFEELAGGNWQLVITELPHGTSSAKILEQLDALSNPQPKPNKKTIDADAQATKSLFLSLLETVRDEAGKEHDVRLVFEPKTKKVDRQALVNTLLAYTQLEMPYSINLVSVHNGTPKQESLKSIIQQWCTFRLATVTRRIQIRVDEIEKRLHILQGRHIALLHIDEVIKVIREADEPKDDLMAKFGLSEIQAEDILEIRLRQLARMEFIKIEKEIAELEAELSELQAILSSDDLLRKTVISEVREDTKKFGDERRTAIEESDRTSLTEAAVVSEPVTIYCSKKGWVKQKQGHGHDSSTVTFKDGDHLSQVIETKTDLSLGMITTDGRAYSLNVTAIPGGRTDGAPISTIAELASGVKPLALISGKDDDVYFMACDEGYGYLFEVSALATRQKAGKAFFSLKDGEKLLPPQKFNNEHYLVVANSEGKGLAYSSDELRKATGGRGLQLIGLSEGVKLEQFRFIEDPEQVEITLVGQRGGEKSTKVSVEVGRRGSKGKLVDKKSKKFLLV